MKFGESLNEGLVPEWKDQYVDYKAGKKIIKAAGKLKDQYEDELASENEQNEQNDRTPLLNPQIDEEDHPTYTLDEEPGNSLSEHEREAPSGTSAGAAESANTSVSFRRPSIFTYLRPATLKSKDKKEEFELEKQTFLNWLDDQLQKVDSFYMEKEQDTYERFLLIQDQLYQLRDHKTSILKEKTRHGATFHRADNPDKLYKKVNDFAFHTKSAISALNRLELPSLPSGVFLDKLRSKQRNNDIDMSNKMEEFNPNDAENRIRNGVTDFNSEFNDESSIDSEATGRDIPNRRQPQTEAQIRQSKRRDYSTKKQHFGVPYLYARKQLKDAILEHYRALSLLKSFKIMNRTAFRKITKKYDKTMKTSNLLKTYMNKVDNESYFQTSDLLDKLTSHVEELFIAFYDPETTDRKHSLEKLKSIAYATNDIRQPTYYRSLFSSGFMLGFGFPLFVLAIYTALRKTLSGEFPEGRFLLQIWGGFFLIILVLLLFGINLAVFDRFKINYKFIFEFDMSRALNYKQFWLLPSFGFFLLSILMWFSFHDFWPDRFAGRDWPWIFFAVSIAIFIWPGDQFYGSSRKWLQIALWRLLLSGLYPVEFRDFFLGDILCSLTYTMGNISFFFCLYAHHWSGIDGDSDSNVCGSSKSRLMGFFATLPSIWRFLQCVRRYMDTGDWFPHLANMLKYAVSALYYCFLSVYRIDRTRENKVIFIIFAFINSIYSATWDVVMDWSLLQSGSKNKYLRDNLFFKQPSYYYLAIIADVILRFQWVFYAFFSNQVLQLAVTSFCIACAEIIRRFIWIFFRMENEHCTNVILFRASKDSPLPYNVSARVEKAIKKLVELKYQTQSLDRDEDILRRIQFADEGRTPVTHSNLSYTTSSRANVDEERDVAMSRVPSGTSSLAQLTRRKSALLSLSEALNRAHIKDFQRRKTVVAVEYSDEEDDDDVNDLDRTTSFPKSKKTLQSVNEDDDE